MLNESRSQIDPENLSPNDQRMTEIPSAPAAPEDPNDEQKRAKILDQYRNIKVMIFSGEGPTETLDKQFVIEGPIEDIKDENGQTIRSYNSGEMPVFSNKDGKVVYIDESNWSAAVILPADSGVSAYTDRAKDCCPLMMRLEKDGQFFILLSHILYRLPAKQIAHIGESVKQSQFKVLDTIFSPRVDTKDLQQAVASVRAISPTAEIIPRGRGESACAFVTADGWALSSGLKKNRQVITEVWQEK